MILVFIFLWFVILNLILFLVIILSTIIIKIENLEIGDKIKNNKYKIFIQLYFLNKLRIFSIKIDDDKIKKLYSNKQIQKVNFDKIKENIHINKETLSIIKTIKLQINQLELKIELGTGEAIFTSYLVVIIASVIGIILPSFVKNIENKQVKYIVQPIYNKSQFNIYLDSIIELKIVHIIYVIYLLTKKGKEKKDERTSNRRAYDYSHEFN